MASRQIFTLQSRISMLRLSSLAAVLLALTIAPTDAFRCRQSGDICDPTAAPDPPPVAKKGDLAAACPVGQVRHTDGRCWTPKSLMALPPPEYDKPWEGEVVEH